MDVTFTVDNGLYRYLGRSWPMRAELVINLWSIGLGRFGPLERAKARLVGEGERARAAAT